MDTTGDFITIIRNASTAGKAVCSAQWSKLRENIVRILKEAGYIKDYKIVTDKRNFKFVKVFLKYYEGRAAITQIQRRSKPGCRVYCKSKGTQKGIPYVLGGLGLSIISTPKGVLNDKEARQNKVGGEVLCYVW